MRSSAKFANTLEFRGWTNGPCQSGLSAVVAPTFRFVSSALLPEVAVDDQKAVGERLARRALGQELRDLGLEERVLDLDRVAGKLARA